MDQHCLVLIDWQTAFQDLTYYGNRNNPSSEQNAARLLDAWREQGLPLAHVRHASLTPGSPLNRSRPGFAFEEFAKPFDGEPVFDKAVNSAFIGTKLEAYLYGRDLTHLILCGVSTDHCVNTSVRMAANLGFDVTLAADACHTFDRRTPDGEWIDAEQVHRIHLAGLSGEFATVLSTQEILSAL